MSRWSRGEADIEQLLRKGQLQHVAGTAANGEPWLVKASTTIETAERIGSADPASAYTLAYDAARFACVGLLAQQGLRPTTEGGHYAVQRAIIGQFGAMFDALSVMRRRRNEIEYPDFPDEAIEAEEAGEAVKNARIVIEAARKLVDHLGLF
jgi:HEPN domain-containing protein